MTLKWLVNRLRSMSMGEVIYRLKQSAVSSFEKNRVGRGWQPISPEPVHTRMRILGNTPPDDGAIAEKRSPASGLRAGRLSLFQYDELEIGWPVNWHRDPLTGVTSPAGAFGKSINYRDDKQVGDIKVLWELGRQQFLVAIAIEYHRQREQSKLDVLAGVLDSWLQQNPYGFGVHWCSSLEVAIRGMSWAFTHQLLLSAGVSRGLFSLDLDVEALKTQVYQHAKFVRGHLSLHSSANNHLIGELTGLNVLCSLFEFGKQSDQWRDFAWQSLQAEFLKQVHTDGVNKEQAVYYHCWVLEYFLLNYILASHNGWEVPELYVSQLTRMAQFVRDLAPPNGQPPQIGDADDGVALQFSRIPSSFFADLITTVNAFSGAEAVPQPGSKADWYRIFLKADAAQKLSPVRSTSYPTSYEEGGYVILGKPQFHAVFDCGPLGYPSIAAHGHADMLSFCLALDGLWWLVDPGTYSYHSDKKWRNYFRGSLAHNVLSINGRDQSEIGGPFMWTRRANARLDGVKGADKLQVASGSHDGYTSEGAARVSRRIEVNPDTEELVVIDQVECTGEIHVDLSFHFSPDISHIQLGVGCILLEKRGTSVRLRIDFPAGFLLRCFRGDAEVPSGWYSSILGQKEPCLTIRASKKVATSTQFSTGFTVIRKT